jgi:hypothetical protein
MNVIDAADATVHDYPGGSESLAPRVGMSAAVLRNKVNPNNPRNVLGLEEAQRLMRITDDHRILQAQAGDLGYALVRVDDAVSDAAGTVLDMVLRVDVAGGEFSRVVSAAVADGVITPNEMAAIERAGHADQAAMIGLVARLRAFCDRKSVH